MRLRIQNFDLSTDSILVDTAILLIVLLIVLTLLRKNLTKAKNTNQKSKQKITAALKNLIF